MMYKSSKGEVEIATMPLRYASNALAKLKREDPGRVAEIEALEAHVAALDQGGEPANPRAVIGGNNPPDDEVTDNATLKWETIKIDLDDLLTEAANWADGAEIANEAQASAVTTLRQRLQRSVELADGARTAEKAPLDKQIAEIQDRYNAYIAPMKNKVPGSASKAIVALGNMLTSWLTKQDDERRAREKEIADAAAVAAAEALAAHAEAKDTTDLAIMDRAEDKIAQAEQLLRQAKGVSGEKVQARGETGRAVGLRSYWIARITDRKAALLHYIATQPEAFEALIQELADKDAKLEAKRGTVPGIEFVEDRKAA